LDGPPFANGDAHVGHAINKILKDFIVRCQIYRGNRVLYRPGWDCHGLPIEMKIAKNTQQFLQKMSPIDIRKTARQIALHSIARQQNSFKRWAVTADWANPYFTMNKHYVANELRLFGELFRRNIVYRAFMPVFWLV
uniref:tRNA-synt_1 domain-containing protein n=1 Tax=Gongylonema pulchrum TaxID=637853 RepID=A0A183DD34_9BILA